MKKRSRFTRDTMLDDGIPVIRFLGTDGKNAPSHQRLPAVAA